MCSSKRLCGGLSPTCTCWHKQMCVCAYTAYRIPQVFETAAATFTVEGAPPFTLSDRSLASCLIQWKESEIERWNTCPGFGLCCFSLEGFGQISPHCLIGLECQGTLGVGKPNDLPVSSFHLSLQPTPCCRLISQSTACPLLESILCCEKKALCFVREHGAPSTIRYCLPFRLLIPK